ncbi:Ankyrin repeat-containing domain protein [Elaphomyces granulatus]
MPLLDLPTELLIDITTYLDAAAMNALACTNKNAYNLLNDSLYYRDLTQSESRLTQSKSRSLTWAAKNGLEVTIQSESRSLTWATENGVEGTIQRAIEVVAIQNLNPPPRSFILAIQVAARRGHVPIVELLLKVHNIDPNYLWGACTETGVDSLIIQRRADLAYQDVNPILNALQLAALQGHVPIVELLLKLHDINPNFQGGSLQAAPLLLAAIEGHSAIVELLLAMPNIDPDVRGGQLCCTPLIYACEKGHVSIVQQLLARNDVDVNARGGYKYGYSRCTPLIKACMKGHVEIINLLLAKEGIDINLVHGTVPICVAAARGDVDLVKLLLDQEGIDVNRQEDLGTTALIVAAIFCNLESAKLLLERDDINVNISANGPGNTALHLACWQESWEVANLLLERDDIDLNAGDLDLYRRRPDPLKCWKVLEAEYPTIAQMARDVLAIPATGAGVERLFNIGRDSCYYCRNRLDGKTIEMIMLIKYFERIL